MGKSFRQFMATQHFPCNLREDEAAPSVGAAPPSPGDPDNKTNKYHFDMLQQQLGMDDEGLTAALESDPVEVYQVPDYSSKWGFSVIGPVSAVVQKRPDGNFSITYQLSQKKLMSPKSFILPYKQGQRPIRYEGPVEDKTEIISAEELQDIMTTAFQNGGAAPAGAMGGMPPGSPGAPPTGGMPPMGGM